jgi:hypothetical protein
MGLTLAELVQLKRADEQVNSSSTRLDIQWGVSPNREGSRCCGYEHCTLGRDGGPKQLDITNGTGFCREHWRFSRSRRHSPTKLTMED